MGIYGIRRILGLGVEWLRVGEKVSIFIKELGVGKVCILYEFLFRLLVDIVDESDVLVLDILSRKLR